MFNVEELGIYSVVDASMFQFQKITMFFNVLIRICKLIILFENIYVPFNFTV